VRTLIPFDSYRLYQIERTKSRGEIQLADERAARLASVVSRPFRAIARAARGPFRGTVPGGAAALADPAACRGTMAGAIQGP
jgi:hypothetical protein